MTIKNAEQGLESGANHWLAGNSGWLEKICAVFFADVACRR